MVRRVAYGDGRDTLVEATVAVVAERGLRGLTFRAIAERARVTNSLIAHHFGTREALLAAALDWAVERSIQSSGLPDLESEERFTESLIATITDQPELQAFQYEMILESRRNPVFREPVRHLYRRYVEVVAEALRARDGDDPEIPVRAAAMFAALDGVVLQRMAGVGVDELRPVVGRVWRAETARV